MATEFKLPEVGEGIESGTVVSLLVAVGDHVEVDQPILELETDKAVVEVPSTVAGVVESIAVQEGQEASIGAVVLTVGEGADAAEGEAEGEAEGAGTAGADLEAEAEAEGAGPVGESPQAPPRPADAGAERGGAERGAAGGSGEGEQATADDRYGEVPAAGAPAGRQPGSAAPNEPSHPGGVIPAAPSVRRLARELGVDLHAVQGSGILGRISAEDVRAFADGRAPRQAGIEAAPAADAPAPRGPELPDFSKWGETERVSMSGIRKATVRSMTQAWSSVPMVTQFDRCDITEFEALRKRHGPQAEALGAKLTPTAMLIKIAAAALRKFPDFNASIDVDAQEIVYKKYVNVGVAVDTENGLLVPVIKDADRKNVLEIAVELGELAEKARARKLAPDDMQGGNFSVSNLGGIGGTAFTPIVNPPDVAILGVSRGGYEPVWDAEQETFVPRMRMPLALTYDHRLIDGAAAARFLRWLCRAIEEPFLMSLEG